MTTLRKGQIRLGPQTWAVIREAYLAGTSAAALAQTYGCSLGTIRYRAVREGWRRCDRPQDGDAPSAADPVDEAPPSSTALHDAAMAAAMRAVRCSRPAEALAYVRVAQAARRLAPGEADGAWWSDEPPEPQDSRQIQKDLEERVERLRNLMFKPKASEGASEGASEEAAEGSDLA